MKLVIPPRSLGGRPVVIKSQVPIKFMKRDRLNHHNPQLRQVACTVSAAALMLGVSSAATVGFHFQCDYCSAASYSGAVVTASAFGVGVNAWESLTQMETGYGCAAGYYTLNQTVNTSPSDPGLNPLPNGSITVTWSAYTANVSGFGGYDRSGPHYTFGGPNARPGNEQVYWGFLRDGVNFGPGSSGGDNNQPGYSIDLVGLKTLFTNTPFAIQLIASADSMQYLTNAFVIDATAGTTQSVVYASTPPVSDSGDTAWVRGPGGGLSTASGALNTDHVQIIGNRAAHVAGKTTGYNFASTISGFIVTDKPVVSMPPNSVLAIGGDSIALSAYAVGVPPLAYQWRHNGAPISGATTTTLALNNVTLATAGSYDLVVTNNYGMDVSSPATVTLDTIATTAGSNYVLDSNPNAAQHAGLNLGATWLASSADSSGLTRTGVMSFSASATNQIVVPNDTNFNANAGTVMFWMRSAGVADPAGNPVALFDRSGADGLQILMNPDGTLQAQAVSQASKAVATNPENDNHWHHVAVTFDQTAGSMAVYVDGVSISAVGGLTWNWPANQQIELGTSHNSFQSYDGLLADVRFYNQVLSDAQIASVYSTSALANASALILRLNFQTAPVDGVTLQWQAKDVILQTSDSAQGPYVDAPEVTSPYDAATQQAQKFYRYRGHTPRTVVSNPFLM